MSETPRPPDTTQAAGNEEGGTSSIPGERHFVSVNRVRSLQSRITTVLTLGVMGTLALALLGWYYSRALAQGEATNRKPRTVSAPTESVLALPALPEAHAPDLTTRVLGPPPPAPAIPATAARTTTRASARTGPVKPDLLLSGPVFARQQNHQRSDGVAGNPLSAGGSGASFEDGDSLSSRLSTEPRAATSAYALRQPRWTLPPGATIDCTLETAITSTLPGMTRCVTATDTWSADGSVVLLERGSQLIGETRGQVAQGEDRIFVVWTQARTPTNVIVPLQSPGTDALGRAGLSGDVNYHFLQRFGAALMISVIDGVAQSASSSARGDAIVINPGGSRELATEILRHTLQIRPTVGVHQGARVQVFVARPVDFGGVYELTSQPR